MSMDDQNHLSSEWAKLPDDLELYPSFYDFVIENFIQLNVDKDADIIDIGCNTGKLLYMVKYHGYQNLSGTDFNQEAIIKLSRNFPDINSFVYNVVTESLSSKYDVIFLTEVIEHVTDPQKALKNLYHSLKPGGYIILTFPNRDAYIPFIYFRWLQYLFKWWPWLNNWIKWFTLPYELRSSQPLDHSYTRREVANFIEESGLKISYQSGMRVFPMLRINGITLTEKAVDIIELICKKTRINWWYYRYLFICKLPDSENS